jgi:aspartate carbamoyltransferase regulatory subunit
MTIDSISNGIVIDHITAGKSMELYRILELEKLDCSVAIIKNASSKKAGRKDIIKIDSLFDIDFDVIGYVDPGITVNIVRDGVRLEKRKLALPDKVVGVIKCKNPRCITSVEQELPHSFILSDREKGVYRCLYCETKAER